MLLILGIAGAISLTSLGTALLFAVQLGIDPGTKVWSLLLRGANTGRGLRCLSCRWCKGSSPCPSARRATL